MICFGIFFTLDSCGFAREHSSLTNNYVTIRVDLISNFALPIFSGYRAEMYSNTSVQIF